MLSIPVLYLTRPSTTPPGEAKRTRLAYPHDGGPPSRSPAATPATQAGKLPFRLKPRLTEEQQSIVKGNPGAHLMAHPKDGDILVAWASVDPQAAVRWLESVGDVDGHYFDHLSAVCAGLMVHGGIEEMQDYLKQHRNDALLPPKYQDGSFDDHPWYLMAREDTAPQAIEYLLDHPDRLDLAGAFISGIPDTDRMLAAVNYFAANGIGCSIDYPFLRDRVEEDGHLLADWAAGSRPDLLEEILIGWHSEKAEEVKGWLDANASRPELAETVLETRRLIEADIPPADFTADE
ncbi:hypothetical protein OKA05_15115 [Luteolibacter arcticus]|uniref:Uncharacterized protein n=1 Tax=Luteolibacter arcticus TaxID=1581411 RepID=A0ABT3GK75_9BACT|nr:hypothetical protein [Luteolibacter arcticus]MCW1923897.1 hypothetical protein [Luteolibacter arcticus]